MFSDALAQLEVLMEHGAEGEWDGLVVLDGGWEVWGGGKYFKVDVGCW